ncbi:hypothetical protein [Corynebacterium sp. CCM 9204]|uniref:hypothetical protein n=1 Tax=Corynebacterium sp. CCM 9204 TaxID=3057616 RepID=UPI003524D213
MSPPPPAVPAGCEDGGQRGLDDTNEVKLSDNLPAGRSGYPSNESCDSGVSTERERLTAHLDVRLSRSEHGEVTQRASALGVKPSAWARAVMRDALDSRRSGVQNIERMVARSRRNRQVDGAKVETLRRIGTTFEGLRRDIARARKDGASITVEVDDSKLDKACAALAELRSHLGDETRL